jgi:hypothetical protein
MGGSTAGNTLAIPVIAASVETAPTERCANKIKFFTVSNRPV